MPITHAPDGEPLEYTLTGPAGRTPILTVHGLASSRQHWHFFDEHYAAERHVLRWDFRGHGGRAAPRDPASATIERFAEDAYAVWRAAELPPVVVTGLSFGVQVALEVWRQHRECVRALVLICGTAGHPLDRVSRSAGLRRRMIDVVRGASQRSWIYRPVLGFLRSPRGRRLAREVAYASGGAQRVAEQVLDDLFGHVADLDPRVLAEVVASYLDHDAFDVLPTITVPTLLVAADRDGLTPVALSQQMQRAIPGSELVVFSGHTHLVQVEKPREVHAAIDAFLARHQL